MPHLVPAITGGTPDSTRDVVFSAIYLALYVGLLALTCKRLFSPKRWLMIHQRPISLGLERIVLFSLRLACAVSSNVRDNKILLAATDGMALAGWLTVVFTLVDMLRFHAARTSKLDKKANEQLFGMLSLLHFYAIAIIPLNIVSSVKLQQSQDSSSAPNLVITLRYVSAALAMPLLAYIYYYAHKIYKTAPRPEPLASKIIMYMSLLTLIIPISLLPRFHYKTPELKSPSPLANYYVFYLIQSPLEFILGFAMVYFDVYALFGGVGKGSARAGHPDDKIEEDSTALTEQSSSQTPMTLQTQSSA